MKLFKKNGNRDVQSLVSVLSLVGLILLFFALQWNSYNAPFERDEGTYAYGAWIMTQGQVPYANTFEQKPPLIFSPYLLAIILNAGALWPIRVIASLSLAATLILIGFVAAKTYGRRAGWLSIWLALPMIMSPYLAPYAANTERFMILPLMGLLAIYLYRRSWFWAGVCGALTLLYKQIGIAPVAFIFLVWLIEDWKTKKSEIWRNLLLATAGGVLTCLFVCGYFFWRGGFIGFWQSTVVYNFFYAVSSGGITLYYLFRHFGEFLTNWVALFFLLLWFIVKRPEKWWFYLGLFLVCVLTIFNTPYSHYYIMLMPIWAIISAAALDSLCGQLALTVKRPNWQTGLAAIFTGVVLFSVLWPVRGWLLLSPTQLVGARYGYYNPFLESRVVAEKVAQMTQPADYVYVAGTEPQISFYAKRLSPTRFSGMYGLMIDQPENLAFQQAVIADLKRRPPAVIAYVKSPLSWLIGPKSPHLIGDYLARILKSDYELVGGSLRYGNEVSWAEPLKTDQLGFCSIMVYKRK